MPPFCIDCSAVDNGSCITNTGCQSYVFKPSTNKCIRCNQNINSQCGGDSNICFEWAAQTDPTLPCVHCASFSGVCGA